MGTCEIAACPEPYAVIRAGFGSVDFGSGGFLKEASDAESMWCVLSVVGNATGEAGVS